MPRKRKSIAPRPRIRFGNFERDHLLKGDCAMGFGCALCRVEDHPRSPCARPLDIEVARTVWEQRREELLAEWDAPKAHPYSERKSGELYGWGHLRPRVPSFAEIFFDAVPLPPQPDPSWPEPARRLWCVIGLQLTRLRMYFSDDEEEYRAARKEFEMFRDWPIDDDAADKGEATG
jgi:hypothetical protein